MVFIRFLSELRAFHAYLQAGKDFRVLFKLIDIWKLYPNHIFNYIYNIRIFS